ncbi:MAG: hypothetical protein JNL44_16135, partial [Gemmatimonadetes bacterium]|nr:hypothetical protein [Gemmatimonadota bacterium]
HLVRATLESLAYQTRDVIEVMNRDSGTRIRELRVDGGAAANDFGMQFQADVLGVPVQAREAMCFAVLGALCQDRVPITLSSVTGVPSPSPVSGAWCFPPASRA